ncbi:MAG: saccharopine dehydrogenase [bacterium]|nr:saccharopine dehydrogenase [bacterium]
MEKKKRKKILVFGSGLVSRPGVRYLVEQAHLQVTVASNHLESAQKLVTGYGDCKAIYVDIMGPDKTKIQNLVCQNDIIISLLPWILHVQIAKMCLECGKHFATTSYVSPGMLQMDEEARSKGVLFLNELGVDPGVDHMSAMKVIDHIRDEGGKVIHFYSICGGLPAPQNNDNPFGYKFSWSPKGVVLASKSSARFMENGKIVDIDGKDLFLNYRMGHIDGIGDLEIYPNRDSLPYRDHYKLQYAETVMRGTYRYPGWCDTFRKLVDLGLVDGTPSDELEGLTYRQMMADLVGSKRGGDTVGKTAEKIGLPKDSEVMRRFEWLGLFDREMVPEYDNRLDILSHLLQEKLYYKEGEIDMLLLRHKFIIENKDMSRDLITSTMVNYGIPHGDSSMARTVSLPLAIGVRLMAEGKINLTGVQIPTKRVIYEPVLKELEELGIKLGETRVPLES